MDSVTVTRDVLRIDGEDGRWIEDEIVSEYPLTLFLQDEEFATIVCTPADLEELTIGFLASEGVIRQYSDIRHLTVDESMGYAYVDLVQPRALSPRFFTKRRITSCCGKSRQSFTFYSDARTAKPVRSTVTLTPEQCFRLMDQLQSASSLHRQTGGVHNAALCLPDRLLFAYSDIGRHNALDKIYGYCLREGLDPTDKILAFSGRISSEVLLKAAKIGAGILLSKSAPTDLALQLADELGITAVGFVRNNRMNVYTHPERIVIGEGNGNG